MRAALIRDDVVDNVILIDPETVDDYRAALDDDVELLALDDDDIVDPGDTRRADGTFERAVVQPRDPDDVRLDELAAKARGQGPALTQAEAIEAVRLALKRGRI